MIFTLKLSPKMLQVLCKGLAFTQVPSATVRPVIMEISLQIFAQAAGMPYPEPKAKGRKPKLKHAKETPAGQAAASRAPA
jgi:hypothetical protein